MSSFYDDASLVVIPSGYKTSKVYAEKPTDGSGDLAFTRTGDTATRVNSAGLIEKVRTNLLQQSQNLAAAAWSLGGTATRTANYGIAPDGTQTSTRIQWTAAASFELYQYTGVATPVYGSVYIKGTNGQTIKYTGNSVTLNGSWQRIEGAIAIDGANTYFSISGTAGTNTAFDFELWGAQAERGDVATPYIPTTTAAVSTGPVASVPRLDYLGSTCPRLLLEPQRTNITLFSEQMNNAAWTAVSCTVSANVATSPDGYTNADSISTTAANSFFGAAAAVTISADASTYTQSIFVKWASGSEVIKLRTALTGGTSVAKESSINIRTGVVVSTDTTAQVVSYGSGWYRISHQATNNSTNTTAVYQFYPTNDGTNTNVIYLWGAQLEVGTYATSYIPTLAASATRGADACSKTGISSLIGQTEGTLFLEVNVNKRVDLGGTGPNGVEITDASGNNVIIIGIGYDANQVFLLGFRNAGSFTNLASTTNNALGTYKLAAAYSSAGFAFYLNGVQIGTGATIPPVATFANFGLMQIFGSNNAQGELVNQALLFKTRLTNAELAQLTTL